MFERKWAMRVVACGDALFSSRNLARRLDRRIVDALRGADAAFANAEFCCPRHDTPPAPRRFVTAVRPEVLDEFVDLNIRLVSFANNHAGDFGPRGVLDTLEAAESRNLVPGGIGRSLDEARAAKFLDTPSGRIALVAASTTRAADFAASAPGKGIVARPGLNPLRFGRAYVLPDAEFAQLQRIDEMLGTAASRREVMAIEVMKDPGPDKFAFGSVFEGSVTIERGERPHVRYFVDERDSHAVLANIRDAANRADFVLMSLHTHEGTDENWYAPRAASFIEAFARKAIEAGAHAVVGHGAHQMRGIEVYQGRPIFYNLNSLLMEFEAGEQRMTPEMYEGFGFKPDALPSQMHMSRVADAGGRRIGFYSDPKFSKGIMAVLDGEAGSLKVQLVPLDLDLNRATPYQRGVPMVPAPALGREIAADLARMSEHYGTRIAYDEADGTISVAAP
jgi:poly-gamma-glutamate capsule biosynthesis protein CapA/YwtB (metallophosphatase superfamily)